MRDMHVGHRRVIGVSSVAVMCVLAAPRAAQPPQPEVAVLLHGTEHETATPDVPGLTAATSPCRISADPSYGTTSNPITVGGAGTVADREIAYLTALRGPAGQGLHFKRLGSRIENGTPVDVYEVRVRGVAEPHYLAIDGYASRPAWAPMGFLCWSSFGSNPAAPDAAELDRLLLAMAVRLGDGDVPPISLDPDGSAQHGVVLDHVRLVARAARTARARGQRLDPDALPADVAVPRTVIIAFPRKCDGRTIAPASIQYGDGAAEPRRLAVERNERVDDLAPGFGRDGMLAVSYDSRWFFENARVTVQYGESCGPQAGTVSFVPRYEEGGALETPSGTAPPSTPPAVVTVQAFLDVSGRPLFVAYLDGPLLLKQAAMEAAMRWRLVQPRVNGAPVYDAVTLGIPFSGR
jgi:hypothetical protein